MDSQDYPLAYEGNGNRLTTSIPSNTGNLASGRMTWDSENRLLSLTGTTIRNLHRFLWPPAAAPPRFQKLRAQLPLSARDSSLIPCHPVPADRDWDGDGSPDPKS